MPTSEDHLLPPVPARKLIEPPAKKSGPSRGKLLFIGGMLVLLLCAFLLLGYLPRHRRQQVVEAAAHREANALPSVNAALVQRAPSVAYLLLPGNITPVTEAFLYARATGYVRRRHADIGDRVRTGQLLAEIDAPDLDAQVAQARATLAQSGQQLAQARAALENANAQQELARVTWERYRVLVSHGAISRQESDQELAAYRQATANVHLQEAAINTAQENIRANQANLDRVMSLQEFKFVRAPFAGVITSRNFDIGAFINAGGGSGGATAGMGGTQTAGAAGNSGASGNPTSGGTSLTSPSSGSGSGSGAELFRVAQIGTVRVLVNVPQSNAPGIRPGQPATVTVQEYDGRKFEGTVTRTSSALDQTSRTLLTEVQVGNPNLLLLPGMYAQVQFGDVRSAPPLLVPGDAVIPSPSGLSVAVLADPTVEDRKHLEDQGHQVANSRRVHLKRVQVGRDYGSEIEVVAGLEGWERVIVNPGDEVREGALVTPHGSSEQVPAGIGASGHTAPTHGKEGQKGDK